MIDTNRNGQWALIAGAVVIAGGAGYALAKFTGRSTSSETVALTAAASAKAPDALQIPESYLTMMHITLEPVIAGDLGAVIQAPATVTGAPNAQATVTARAAGTLVRLNKRLGDQVNAGDVLAVVESRDAAAMAADRTAAEASAELARSILKREQSLYEQKVTPRQDLEAAQARLASAEAEATRAKAAAAAAGVASDGRTLAVISPIAGRITTANAVVGEYVEPAMELFRVADPRFVLVEAAVPAMDAPRINAGNAAKVTTGAGMVLDATVVSVTPTVNEQTRSATVSLSLAAGQSVPAPGEFVQVVIETASESATGIVIPADAVQSINGSNAVFVRTENGFKVATVVVGARSGGRAAILSGLQAGEIIATQNAFLLKAELTKGAEEEE